MHPIFLRSVHPPFGTIELLERCRSFCHRIVLNKIAAEMPKPLVLNWSIGGETKAVFLGGFYRAGGVSNPADLHGPTTPWAVRGKDSSTRIRKIPLRGKLI